MDWMSLIDLFVDLLRPLVWAISAHIAFPSIGKLIVIIRKTKHNIKEKHEINDKISKDFSEDLENDKK